MTSSMSISGSSSDKPSGSGKSQGSKSNYGPQRGKSKPKRGRSTGLALVGTRAPTCGFCQGGHWSDNCQKVKGLKQRKDHCAENKLCYICLKPGHFSNNCKNDKPCYYCQKKGHNQALCNENDKKNGKRDASKGGKSSKGGGGTVSDEDTITALHATEYSNKVLLMTALTTVTNLSLIHI